MNPAVTAKASGRPMPLLTQVRQLTRTLHMSIRTEEAYCQWIERFLRFHKEQSGQWRHPAEMGSDEINAFLTHLAVQGKVAASTQNQALSALLFLYTKVLKLEITIDAVRMVWHWLASENRSRAGHFVPGC